MDREKEAAVGIAGTPSKDARGGPPPNRSLRDPEEGRRLVHAFLSIRQPAIRQAIIEYVEEQARLHKPSVAR
jgi:hypothetical protein